MRVRSFWFSLLLSCAMAGSVQGWTLNGRVTGRSDVLPGVSCRLFLDGVETAKTLSDEKGCFVFDGLDRERVRVVLSKNGFFDAARTVMNFTGGTCSTAVSMTRRQRWTLTGSLRGPAGEAVEGARIRFRDTRAPAGSSGELGTAVSDGEGRFRFDGLFDTAVSFTVEAEGYRRRSVWKRNTEQADLTLDVDLVETDRRRLRRANYRSLR